MVTVTSFGAATCEEVTVISDYGENITLSMKLRNFYLKAYITETIWSDMYDIAECNGPMRKMY